MFATGCKTMSLIVAISVFVAGAPATFPISGNPPDAVTNVVNALQTAALKRGQLESDQLMEYYVREAAKTAVNLPKKDAVRAFLLGMGRGIADGRLGSPTMRGRADLAQHFFVSAMLTELSGPKQAESAGIAKEVYDMNFGSGFSFSDVLADFAGVAFARRLKDGDLTLAALSSKFRCGDYLPDPVAMKFVDGLSPQAFAAKYGSLDDKRFLQVIRTLRENVRSQYKTHPSEKD